MGDPLLSKRLQERAKATPEARMATAFERIADALEKIAGSLERARFGGAAREDDQDPPGSHA